jgi:ubiquinone/menaquinone biosynthesis C-methylase UbiE
MRGLEQMPRVYDPVMAILDRGLLGTWRSSLARESGGPLLEIGCGTGRTLKLHPRTDPVVGLDPDPVVLRAARRRAPHALLVRARAEALPFRDGSFAAVVSSLAFCSVEHPLRGLEEARRVLGDEGELRMLEHVRPRSRLGARIARLLRPPWTLLTGGCRPDRDTLHTVREAGFRIRPSSTRSWWLLRRFDAVPLDPASGGQEDR